MLNALLYTLLTALGCAIFVAPAFFYRWLCWILHVPLGWIRSFFRWVNWEKVSMFTLAGSLFLVTLLTTFVSRHPDIPLDPEIDTSIYEGLRVAFSVFEGDSGTFREHMTNSPLVAQGAFWYWFLRICACVLPVLVPLSTVGTATILLWNHLPHHVPILSRNWYIFSELNPNSIRMAKSINEKLKKEWDTGVFIFLRTRRGDQSPEILDDIRTLNYYFHPKTEDRFLIWPLRRFRRMRFFFLSETTDENFERMQEFLEAVKNKWLFCPMGKPRDDVFQQELYLLSETESAPMLIDHLRDTLYKEKEVTVSNADGTTEQKKEKVKRLVFSNTELRLLDRFRATSYDLLRTVPLHKHIHKGSQEDTLNVLLLGFGKIGREFFRAAASMGVIHNCKTEFTLCDQQICSKLAVFQSKCPELYKSVTFYSRKLNIDTAALNQLIEARDYHYIVVALGDDELNIRVSSRLKQFYRHRHWKHEASESAAMRHPQICVNIEDSIKHDYVKNLWNTDIDKSWDKELYVFGGLDEAFTPKVLMPEDLWKKACRIHRELNQLKKNEPINWDEYQRRSSIACASHMEYIVDDNWLSKYDTELLADTEHQRWMAYVRSEGMCQSSLPQVAAYRGKNGTSRHIDKLGKLTPCLVETEKLDEIWKEVENNHQGASSNGPDILVNNSLSFRERDKLVVEKASEWMQNSKINPCSTNKS